MKKKRLRGLFFNAILALSLISLVPVFFIGFHVMRVDSRILQNEILQKQRTVVGRLSSVLHSHITHTAQLFSVFADLHTDFGGHEFVHQQDLTYLRTRNPSIVYLAVLDQNARAVISSGESVLGDQFPELWPQIKESSFQAGEEFLGKVYRIENQLFTLMTFPLRQHLEDTHVQGVLLAELDLREMGRTLAQAYPLDMEAWVVSGDGDVVSYSGAPREFLSETTQALLERTSAIQAQLGVSSSGKVTFPDSGSWLVTSANLFLPGWKVYVAQRANVATQLLRESTVNSVWDVVFIFAVMLLFVVGVSYLVIIPIIRPLDRLRRAILRLRETEGELIRREDVEIPNNEIGDLSELFVEMSEALYSRRKELLQVQQKLASSNQDLEQRVEERTRELKETTNELVKTERLAAIGQMASIISHEIRNPLAVISNATRLIKMLVASPDPKIIKQFGIIEAEIKQANSIISEVLGYARTRELMLSTVEVNSYVNDLLAAYPLPPGIHLERQIDEESVRMKVDAEEIKQALRNIISNAVEAMGTEGTLTVGTKVGRRVVCIFVTDTGPGITEEIRRKMFAPFFTTKARGTGLGLAVVGKAISRHHGKLLITSGPGKGTCFQIYLKIYRKTGDTDYGTAS